MEPSGERETRARISAIRGAGGSGRSSLPPIRRAHSLVRLLRQGRHLPRRALHVRHRAVREVAPSERRIASSTWVETMNAADPTLLMPTALLGRVLLLPSKTELGASTTEIGFLASPDGSGSSRWISNPPHRSYLLSEDYSFESHRFRVGAWFSSSSLVAVHLSMVSGRPTNATWEQWDVSFEQAMNQKQVDLLRSLYGSHPVKCSWGTITSTYDPRGGDTSIWIRFNSPSSGKDLGSTPGSAP